MHGPYALGPPERLRGGTIMIRKLGLLLTAVAVIAFAAPAVAGAHAVTSPKGVLAPVGTVMNATGNDITITSATLGAITCLTLDTEVTLNKNNGVFWEAAGPAGVPVQAGCKTAGDAGKGTPAQNHRPDA